MTPEQTDLAALDDLRERLSDGGRRLVTVQVTHWHDGSVYVEAWHTHPGEHPRHPRPREAVRVRHREVMSGEGPTISEACAAALAEGVQHRAYYDYALPRSGAWKEVRP